MTMKLLFRSAERWMRESGWRDLALVKLCLCALGVLLGLAVPKGKKKAPLLMAAAVFVTTYVPLMGRFLGLLADEMGKPQA